MAGRGKTATSGPAGRTRNKNNNFSVEDIPDFAPRTRSANPVRTPGDYTKNIAPKRQFNGRRPDQPGERPMATTRSGGGKSSNVATTSGQKKPSWYTGKKTTATATVKKTDNTRQQFENAFGSKATGLKAKNSDTGKVTEQNSKPSWYTGKKTKATATVRKKGSNS